MFYKYHTMKNAMLLMLIFLFFNCYSKGGQNDIFANSKLILGDFLWIAKTEVSNAEYREFLLDVQNNDNYKELLPDTSLWNETAGHAENYVQHYFRHPSYSNFPIVCISKEQAIEYCNWLAIQLNNKLIQAKDNDIEKVRVRLPTKWEWQYAARGGLSKWNEHPWEGSSLRRNDKKNKGRFMLNFRPKKGNYTGDLEPLSDNADITAPVKSYWANGFELFNMCGNVSEMVSDYNRAYGGNWTSSGFNTRISSYIKSEPASTVGFRYVIEVTKWRTKIVRKKEIITKKFLKSLFVKINDSLHFMKTEVKNELYNCFLRETNSKRPDSTLWKNRFWYSDQYMLKYHWHPNYTNYPVVNITKKDVKAFNCWLTQKFSTIQKKDVQIRLPSEQEWMLAARLKNSSSSFFPWGESYVRNSNGSFLCNYRTIPEIFLKEDSTGNSMYEIPEFENPIIGADLDGYSCIAPVASFWKNEYGLFDMSGNIAEMIKDQNFTKGGSWWSELDCVTINARENHVKSSPTVGFRLVMIK